jgi:hypothetical protein
VRRGCCWPGDFKNSALHGAEECDGSLTTSGGSRALIQLQRHEWGRIAGVVTRQHVFGDLKFAFHCVH